MGERDREKDQDGLLGGLIRSSIRRPVTVCMITVGFLAFGTIALQKLPINLLPDLSYPTLTLETRYPGAAPEEVEYLVTRPVEEAVAVIPLVRRIHSSSKPELSLVTVEFDWGRQMDFAVLDVSKKVDLLRMPDGVEKPRILRYDPNQDPIVKVSVTSDEMSLTELRFFAEEDLKKRLDGVPGLASVKVLGGLEEIVEIRLDEMALKRFGLDVSVVAQRLREENVNRAGGSLYENEARYLVRTLNEFRDLEDIGDTIVARFGDRKIYLKEVADIQFGHKDRELIARNKGQEGIEMAFYKEGDANTVQVSRALSLALDKLKETFEGQIQVATTYDGAAFIENAIDEVVNNAVIGGLIAIVVLFLFLRDIKGTLIVGLSIPISVFVTFFLMLQSGVSLNIMSLGGLALGIGMLVDNSIVVLESVFVRKAQGDNEKTAAASGASMVSGAVMASTLTTIVVFLPMVFVTGIAGQLFKDLGLSVSFALLASLAAAITLIPTLYALFSRRRSAPSEEVTAASDDTSATLPTGMYSRILALALRMRYAVIVIALLAVTAGAWVYRSMGQNLIPELNQGDFFVLLELPEGTPIERTDQMASQIEARLMQLDAVSEVFSTVGEFNQGVEERSGENLAQVNFSLLADEPTTASILVQLRNDLEAHEEMSYQLGRPSYFSFKTPIEIEIYSDDRKALETVSAALVARMHENPHVRDVRSTVADGNPEVRVVFNRDLMSKLGLSIGDVAELLRNKIQGTSPTRFSRSGRDVDIVIRLREEDRRALEQLESLAVGYRDGKPIFLSSVADIQEEIGPAQIKRVDKKRCAVVSAGIRGNNLSGVMAELEPVMNALDEQYPAVDVVASGQSREMEQSIHSLLGIIALAIFLVYLVMASQFESLLHPLLILFTVPIGLVGGLLGLFVAGYEISVIAMIGGIMLAGIVVNNAIVLIDYINQLRRRGTAVYEALITAGCRRLRPILMTTTTTVLGLLPMALGVGEGAEMRAPLAITVIGGLLFSTLLTLIFIPVLYAVVSRGFKIPGRGDASA